MAVIIMCPALDITVLRGCAVCFARQWQFLFMMLVMSVTVHSCGFGGTQVRGFAPGRSRRIFRAKKSSARLPSEGK
jgi:hypothetical protein